MKLIIRHNITQKHCFRISKYPIAERTQEKMGAECVLVTKVGKITINKRKVLVSVCAI